MDGARSFVIALAFGMTILATSLALMTGEERKLRTRAGTRENDIVKVDGGSVVIRISVRDL